jgi:hypothetical protein
MIAECARIDEAAEIKDKAAALAAYARQRDDTEKEVWTSEIRLRACRRIGEISISLEKVPPGPSRDTSHRREVSSKTTSVHGVR